MTVVTGDGALGYPPRAPYDRIIATVAVQRVPCPWIAQTRPGGRVITPWGNAYHNGALLSLTVFAGGTAVGPHGRRHRIHVVARPARPSGSVRRRALPG